MPKPDEAECLIRTVLGKRGRSIHELSQEELIVLVHELLRALHAANSVNETLLRVTGKQQRALFSVSVGVSVIGLLAIASMLFNVYAG